MPKSKAETAQAENASSSPSSARLCRGTAVHQMRVRLIKLRFPKMRPESEEYLHLDALRFIASLGIVLHHYREDWRPNAWVMTHLDGMNLFVDLFFAISGVIISYVYGNRIVDFATYRSFLWRRIARLVPLHWLTMAFFIVVGLAASLGYAPKSDHYDWSCLPANVLMIHSAGVCQHLTFNYVSWSISAEMLTYLMLPFLLLVRRRGSWLPPLLALVMLAAMYAAPTARPWWEWTYDFGVARAVVGFCIGMGIFSYREALGRIPAARYLLASVLILFVAAMTLAPSKGLLAPFAYVIVALGVAADQQKVVGPIARWLAPLGSLTFGLYMIHTVVRTVVISVVGEKVLGLTGAALDLVIVLAVLISVAGAYVSKFWFEDPMRRWLTSWGQRRGLKPEEAVAP